MLTVKYITISMNMRYVKYNNYNNFRYVVIT